jgi:hypothetical protein
MMLGESLAALRAEAARLAQGRHEDPFAVLGRHRDPATGRWCVRVFAPEALAVELVHAGSTVPAEPVAEGFFLAPSPTPAYRLRLHGPDGARLEQDPYRFGLAISLDDAAQLKLGRCWRAHQVLGAHPVTLEGEAGVRFAVWAPHARRASVAGSWNGWSGLRHPMRYRHEIGVWEIFLPGLAAGVEYVFELATRAGRTVRRPDPYARALSPAQPHAARCVAAEPARPTLPPAGWSGRARALLAGEARAWGLAQGEAAARCAEAAELGFGAALLLEPCGAAPFAPAAEAAVGAAAAFAQAARANGLRPCMDLELARPPQSWLRFDGEALYEQGVEGARHWQHARYEAANLLWCAGLHRLEDLGFAGLLLRGLGQALWPAGGRLDTSALDFCCSLTELLRARAPDPELLLLGDELGEWPAASWPTADHGLGLDAAHTAHWPMALGQGAGRAAALVALGAGPQLRALQDWRRWEARPGWARAKLAALLALTAPGWALFSWADLAEPFPGAAQDGLALADWRGFLQRALALAAQEPALGPHGRLRLLAQPAGANGPIVFAREHAGVAAVVAFAPQNGYRGPAPAPFPGRYAEVLRTLAPGAGGARTAFPDLGSPSGFSVEIEMAQDEGLVLLGRRG